MIIKLRVKLPPHVGELCVPTESKARADKERGMRQRRLKAFWSVSSNSKNERPNMMSYSLKSGPPKRGPAAW